MSRDAAHPLPRRWRLQLRGPPPPLRTRGPIMGGTAARGWGAGHHLGVSGNASEGSPSSRVPGVLGSGQSPLHARWGSPALGGGPAEPSRGLSGAPLDLPGSDRGARLAWCTQSPPGRRGAEVLGVGVCVWGRGWGPRARSGDVRLGSARATGPGPASSGAPAAGWGRGAGRAGGVPGSGRAGTNTSRARREAQAGRSGRAELTESFFQPPPPRGRGRRAARRLLPRPPPPSPRPLPLRPSLCPPVSVSPCLCLSSLGQPLPPPPVSLPSHRAASNFQRNEGKKSASDGGKPLPRPMPPAPPSLRWGRTPAARGPAAGRGPAGRARAGAKAGSSGRPTEPSGEGALGCC